MANRNREFEEPEEQSGAHFENTFVNGKLKRVKVYTPILSNYGRPKIPSEEETYV